MQKSSLLVWIGLLCSGLSIILPVWYKIIPFVIIAILLSYVYQREKNTINFLVLLCISGLYLICNSTLISLDASNTMVSTLNSFIDGILGVAEAIVIIVPIVGCIAGVIACIAGVGMNIDALIRVVILTVTVILITIIYIFICTLIGIPLIGMEWIQNFIINAWNWIATQLQTLGGTVIGTIPNITLSSSNISPHAISLTVSAGYPLILSFITFLVGCYYKIFDNKIVFGSRVNEPQPILPDDSNRFTIASKTNLSFLAFIVIEFCVWIYFAVSYTPEVFLTYQNILFFSVYSIIVLGVSIFLYLGTGILAKNTIKGTLIGTLLGILLLFMFQNMFVSQTVSLSSIKNEVGNPILIQIANYFMFVSPTETLLFQIFLPALILLYFFNKNRVLSEPELIEKIDQCNTQISIYTAFTTYDVVKSQKKLEQLANEKAKWQKLLKELNLERELGLTPAKTKMTSIQFLEYLLLVVIFNIGFGMLHFFKSGFYPDISSFIASGLLAIYTCSGMIISLIGYKYGWISAILSHALFDSITLILVFVMSGGLI